MAKANIEMKVNVSSAVATRKIEKATRAAEKLQEALNNLKEVDIEIGVKVVRIKKRWWQFWR